MAASPPEVHDGATARMRGDERREQLIRVAMDLFSRKGFSGTTTKEIAQAAGVTEALIFRHFPTKEALYDAILRSRVESGRFSEGWAAVRAAAERRDDFGIFQAITHGMFEFHRENVDFLRLMFYAKLEGHSLGETFRERHINQIDEFLRDYVASRQAEGAFREVDPQLAVQSVLGMAFFYSINAHLFHCRTSEVDDLEALDTLVRIALDGLRRPQPESEPEEQV
jgi:TetR/AcrR family transcriptional regulator